MPTYAYACTECGHRFDAVQSFSDPALTSCPACEGRLRKEYGSIGVTFNGSGFYRTDSRAGDKKSSGGAGGDTKAASGDSSSSSPSSKSEATSSPAPSGS